MEIREIEIEKIIIGQQTRNDRTVFAAGPMEDLANSIRKHGLRSPISVRETPDGYRLVAGERRTRAHKMLNLKTIMALVSSPDPVADSIEMLVENAQREQLTPIELARAYRNRLDDFGWSVEELSDHVGHSVAKIQKHLALLGLAIDVQDLLHRGVLSIGYATILANAELDPDRQRIAVRRLNQNPAPSIGWFRRIVGELQEQQCTIPLMPLFGTGPVTVTEEIEIVLPPDPANDVPPILGRNRRERIGNAAKFWMDAADKWAYLGKPAKRDACIAAAQALRFVAQMDAETNSVLSFRSTSPLGD